MAVGVLLDVDVINFTKVGTDTSHLVLDVHEEGRVFLEVNLCRIEHANKENAVAWFRARLRLESTRTVALSAACLGLASTLRATWQHRVLIPTEFLHQSCAVLCRVDVGVGGVLTQVLLLILLLSFGAGPIRQDVHLQFRALHQLEAIHGLGGDAGLLVSREFND